MTYTPNYGPLFEHRTLHEEPKPTSRVRVVNAIVAKYLAGGWRTLDEIQAHLAGLGHRLMVTSVSARVRDCRKAEYGGHDVAARARPGCGGLWEYQIGKANTPA